MESADLITWDRNADAIETTTHPALSDPKLREMLAVELPEWDDVRANLAIKRRRVVLASLEDHDGAMMRAALAAEVVPRETDEGATTEPPDDLLAELPPLTDSVDDVAIEREPSADIRLAA